MYTMTISHPLRWSHHHHHPHSLIHLFIHPLYVIGFVIAQVVLHQTRHRERANEVGHSEERDDARDLYVERHHLHHVLGAPLRTPTIAWMRPRVLHRGCHSHSANAHNPHIHRDDDEHDEHLCDSDTKCTTDIITTTAARVILIAGNVGCLIPVRVHIRTYIHTYITLRQMRLVVTVL